jgi:nucleotide-binding universal stress UspA family protein
MKTILVPLDGSALAEQALPYAQALATLLSANVRLLQVISKVDPYNLVMYESHLLTQPVSASNAPSSDQSPSVEFLRQQANDYLAARADRLRKAALEVETQVQFGNAAEVIVEVAQAQQAEMIVMASHGYSGLKRWALGSVADKVLHAATTPVFLVRGSSEPALIAAPLKRILVPLDGSALARQALPVAVELATHARAELVLLTAVIPPLNVAPELMSPTPRFDDAQVALRDRLLGELGTFADELQRQQLTVRPLAVNGFAAETVIDEAARLGADLIVMATHGYSGLRRWALGSVADKVLHGTRTPLLLVRAQAKE